MCMSNITTGDVVIVENRSGGRAVLTIEKRFSSRVYFKQELSQELDFCERDFLRAEEFRRYEVTHADSVDDAQFLVAT